MKAQNHQVTDAPFRLYIRYALEGLWLVAALAVPLAMAPQDSMISYIQLPKLALLRTLVALMAGLWTIEWLFFSVGRNQDSFRITSKTFKSFWHWLRQEPTRLVLVASGFFIAVYILSSLLSASVSTSVWGSRRIWDGYSLFNILTYYMLFLVIAIHLQSKPQLWRLLGAIVVSAGIGAFLGLLEQERLIPIGSATTGSNRIESTFGNPIFFGSFLTMAIPLTIGFALLLSHRLKSWKWLVPFAPLVSMELLALALTISRGPLFALIGGLLVFIALGIFAFQWRDFAKISAFILICSVVAFVSLRLLPDNHGNEKGPTVAAAVEERIFKSYPEVASGGISNRGNIWKSSAKLLTQRPWLPFAGEISLMPLRPIIGYGPELYGYVYPLEASPDSGLQLNAHNQIIHLAVEIGYLGAASYVGILATIFLPLLWILWKGRRTLETDHKLILVALLAAFSGRVVEQMIGVARIGDITLFWIALAIVPALTSVLKGQEQNQTRISDPLFAAPLVKVAPKLTLALIVFVSLLWVMTAKNINYFRADVKAASAFASHDTDEAIAFLDESVSLAPDVPIYYRRRADTLKQRMNGIEDLQYRAQLAEMIYADRYLATQIAPLAGENLFGQANAALELNRLGYQGKGDEAAQLYQNLIELAPNLTEFHIILRTLMAIAFVDSGQSDKAIVVLDELLAMDPEASARSKALYIQGAAYYEIGNVPKTIESLKQSLTLGGDMEIIAQSHLLLSKVYGDMGEAGLAEYHTEKYKSASISPQS